MVEILFLLVAFVALPGGIHVLAALGTGVATQGPGRRFAAVARLTVLPSAVALAASLALPAGWLAALLAMPWVATTGLLGVAALIDRFQRGLQRDRALIPEAALGFAAIGGLLVLDHRLGADPFGFSQFLVLLAAIHFHVAGFVLLTTITALSERRGGTGPLVAGGLAIIGGPLTAIGFFGLPGVNIAGAAFTATAGLMVGLFHLDVARSVGARLPAALLAIAGASLLVTMPMAATWAIGLLTGLHLLPLEVMTRVHGGLNAVGFGLAAVMGWHLAIRHETRRS